MKHIGPIAKRRDVPQYNNAHWKASILALAAAIVTTPLIAQTAPSLSPVTVDPTQRKVRPVVRPTQSRHANARPKRTQSHQQLAKPIVPVVPLPVTDASPVYADGSTVASGGTLVQSPSVGPFGNTPQNDIPFSVNSIPQVIIEDQQAKTAADILRNDPSVVENITPSQSGYPNFSIRGFDTSTTSGSNRIDGLPFTSQAAELIYDYERVDIYKGADALLYGFSSPGGLVNYVSKKPLDQPLTNLSFNYISPSWFGGTADVSRRFGEGDQFGVRVNLAAHGGDLGINTQVNKDVLAALALDWKPVSGTRVWFNGSYGADNYQGVQPNFAIGTATIVPQTPDTSKLYGQSYSHHDGKTDTIEGGMETKITPWLDGHITAGEVVGYRDVRYNGGSFINNSGSYTLASNPDNLWHLTDYSAEALISPHFEVGIVKNKMDFGTTFNRETYQAYQLISPGTDGTFNLANPYFVPDKFFPHATTFLTGSSTDSNNYVFRDTLDITKYVTLVGGVAYSTISHYDSSNATYFQGDVTPSGAIIIKPIDGMSLYGSYIQGLQNGTDAAQTFGAAPVTNAFAYLSPFVSTQYEVGAKYNLNNALQLNAALFQISEPNAVYTANNGGASYTYGDNGQQRNRGFEFTAVGKVYEGLRIFSGFTYLSSEIEQSQGGIYNGLQAIAEPHWRGNLFAEYDIPMFRGLTLMGGFYYTGSTFLDSANMLVVPGYVTGDIGAKYVTSIAGNQTTFRFYVQNFTGANHWLTTTSGQLELGDPRTFKVDVSMRF